MRTLMIALILSPSLAFAADMAPREGWSVIATEMPHATVVERVIAATSEEGMAVVTQAGPTGAARDRGIEIPENRVIGVFNNDFAVRILALSTPAMIEAPIRFYVTEDEDGTATLSWKTPSFVLAPYTGEAGPDLAAIAGELDAKFDAIATRATQ